MNKNRPVNLDLTTFSFPLPAITSILHRISGVLLFVGVGFLIYALDKSLANAASYNELQVLLSGNLVKLITWVIISALLYHFVAGIKHLLMDLGIGETLEGARTGAILTMVISAALIAFAGVVLW